MENIKSFFQKEEELGQKPKAVPEAASEIYNRPAGSTPPVAVAPAQRIVEKPLPQKLPFSPEDLRQALKVEKPEPKSEPKPIPVERDITHEIDAFESALRAAHDNVQVKPALAVIPQVAAPTRQPTTLPPKVATDSPFFNEFEQFITHKDLDAEGLLEKDVIFRMKEFHKHLQSGKEYYLYGADVQQAVTRKLQELKALEQEWFSLREQADRLEHEMHFLETEIETRSGDLKSLLRQARAKSRLERTVPQGQEFMLSDGRKLASLLDLKVALHKMPDPVFNHHVTSIKNDFAAWIRGTMDDPELADQIGPIRDRQQLELFLSKLSQ